MSKQITLFDGTSLSKEAIAIKLIQEFEKYPKYKTLYKKLADEIEKEMQNDNWKNNSKGKYSSYFEWWMKDNEVEE